MTTTTGTDLAPRLRAFKHRLDPNPAQATLLAQYAGAARVAYNMLTAHNRAALAAGAARRTELAETGLAGPELAARMKAERAADTFDRFQQEAERILSVGAPAPLSQQA